MCAVAMALEAPRARGRSGGHGDEGGGGPREGSSFLSSQVARSLMLTSLLGEGES